MTSTTLQTAARIRREFIDFFLEKHDHAFVPSSPVIPHNDPTLLFTNAGMNQFKGVFLGQSPPPSPRVANSQKCIRAGGKHNDLEDVGKDHYHHTFFEMLGNWSFGDYFKAEAIEWAWQLLTDVWAVDQERLYVTVFAGDPHDGLDPDVEAEDLWKRHVDPARIVRLGKKDNFWEMGDTGPCGPCSEILYDVRRDEDRAAASGEELVRANHPDLIEIWNLVFIQFNRSEGGRLTPLPARHVDTGMGFERLVRVLQGRDSNYDTDVWTGIFQAIADHTRAHPYRGTLEDPVDIAYRVIADHVRCLTVAITDGGRPSNEKAGYVLRRILRRAVRHAHQTLAVEGPLLCDLVPAVVESLASAFPELQKNPQHVADLIRDEEESFLQTLDRGLALFAAAADRADAGGRISAEDAFRLHDTYGFPIDLTRVMAEERAMTVDEAGFEQRMEQARQISRRGPGEEAKIVLPPEAIAKLRALGVNATDDTDKYHGRPITATVRAIWNGTDFDEDAEPGTHELHAIVTDRTNFYAEQGGQIGDTGVVRDVDQDRSEFQIVDTRLFGEYVLHIGRMLRGRISVAESVQLTVDRDRREAIRANHTATHLLNFALREVLGEDEQQKGSLVAPDRLRFDFSCPHAMDAEQLAEVELRINEAIAAEQMVYADFVDLPTAMSINGLRAVFGEKYPDPVRVVSVGAPVDEIVGDPGRERWRAHPIELCGGTHLSNTGDARRCVIVHEQALAAGVRRITAATGAAALAADTAGADLMRRAEAAAELAGDALVEEVNTLSRLLEEITISAVTRQRISGRLETLRPQVRQVQKQADAGAREQVLAQARTLATRDDGRVIVEVIEGANKENLLSAMDVVRARHPEAAAMLFSPDPQESKVSIVAAVPPALVGQGLRAGDWVKEAASVCGGGGGGRPDLAQAGGRDPDRVQEAMAAARRYAERILS